MSDSMQERPPQNARPGAFAIVASRYNAEFVRGLAEHAKAELAAIRPNAEVLFYEVPGAFEIPVVVQEVAASGKVEAVIAVGVIIQGATQHADLVGKSVTDALQQIALKHRTPVIHEVLLVSDAAQARERCLDEKLNRGTEAARSAVRVAEVVTQLKAGR